MAGLIKRGETWHLRMRVPKRYLEVAGRGEIHRSLHTQSKREAEDLRPGYKAQILEELEQLATIQAHPSAADTYLAAQKIVEARNFSYRPISELLKAPLEEVTSRVEAASVHPSSEATKALLGAFEKPALRLSKLVDEVERIAENDNRYKSENQMRLWRNPRKRAVANLQAALGGKDILVSEIDHAAALKHKAWWKTKITEQNLSLETANKDFSNMAGMLRHYYEDIEQPDPPEPYHRVSLRDRHKVDKRKLEIPVDWITQRWFAPDAFSGINVEARDILLMLIETGCRQSEICDLPPSAIKLDHKIPHICIRYEEGEAKREVKNPDSVREVPLMGVALAAAKRHPDGFPRYRGKSTFSATMNKYLSSNGLLPTPEHTIGGVRHTWESRLKKVDVSNDDRGDLMGHSIKMIRDREVYGDDMLLKARLKLMKKIKLAVPEHLR